MFFAVLQCILWSRYVRHFFLILCAFAVFFLPVRVYAVEYNAPIQILLPVIAQIESSNNPLADRSTSSRDTSRGLYQITKIALADYNAYHADKLTFDEMFEVDKCEKVASWMFNKRIPQLLRHYRLEQSLENTLSVYNGGIGAVRKGFIAKSYIAKYRRFSNGH